jgi:hypothetical protein
MFALTLLSVTVTIPIMLRKKSRKPPRIKFDVIPVDQVPSWSPIARPSMNRKESQWDEVLTTLERKPGIAVKIVEDNARKRNSYKSTLQTQAKNWGLDVRVRTDGNAFYAWKSEEVGRFPPPDVR